METAAQRLKFARKLRGLNQVQLAGKAGVATGTVGNIEAGTRGIQGSALKLAKALAVDPNWLADGEGEAPTPAKAAPTPKPSSAPMAQAETTSAPTLAQALEALSSTFARTPEGTRNTVATLVASAIKDPATLPDCLRALDALAQYSAASLETSAMSKAKA